MKDPSIHQKTIEDTAYNAIKKLAPENYKDIRYWIESLISFHGALGNFHGREQLKKELEDKMNDDK